MSDKTVFIYGAEQPTLNYRITDYETHRRVRELPSSKQCAHCDAAKAENKKLKKMVERLQRELESLQLKHLTAEKAIPLSDVYSSVVSTHEDEAAWEQAWNEQHAEWLRLVQRGKMSRIKFHRLMQGLDQTQLAAKLEMRQPNIARLERVGHTPRIGTLRKIAGVLRVSVEALLER